MLSHDSMTYAARQNMSLFKLEYAQETSVSYLPQVCLINIRTDPTQLTIWVKYECDNQLTSAFAQSHILGMMMDIYNMIPAGGVCYFADKNALKGTLLENIQHYRWISSLLEQIWYLSTQTNTHCGSSKSVGEDRGGDQVQGVIAGAKKDGRHHHHNHHNQTHHHHPHHYRHSHHCLEAHFHHD